MRSIICGGLVVLATSLTGNAPAHAQYPNKTIRLIVPFGAGSANDTVARLISTPLSTALGRPVIIDNRPGVAGNIGAEIAAKTPPDGYTVMMTNISHAISMTLYDKPGFDLVKDFAAVSLLASGSFLLAVHPSTPAKSVKELIALAKARPGQLNVATAGSGIYLASQLFNGMTGIKMTNVTYRSTPQAVAALVSGETSVGFPATSSAFPHVESGRLRALGVTSVQRLSIARDIPTVAEAGVPGFEASPWYGLMVPAGTPQDVIARLHAESVKALSQPDVKERFGTTDLEPIGSTPEQFGAYVRSEIAKWGKIVKATGMRPE
jgi:tripartite-type tricarboxylate transporter receptor subunit TctC